MLKVPSTIEKVETRADKTLKLVIGTQELSPEDEAEIMRQKHQLGYFVFSATEAIKAEDIPTEELDNTETKTPGQRLRAVLYLLWKQNPDGYKEFEGFYRGKMDRYITAIKEKLI